MVDDNQARLLVFGDRDAAEEALEAAAERIDRLLEQPRLVREELAGEDDAEDAQWLVVLSAPGGGWSEKQVAVMDEIAAKGEGWVEEPG